VKFQEPEIVNPVDEENPLVAGDQIGCHDSGGRLRLLTCAGFDEENGLDVVWLTLGNVPAETTHIGDWPVPARNVALHLGPGAAATTEEDHTGWKVVALPQVLARRRIK
jgi:hypothetical protein